MKTKQTQLDELKREREHLNGISPSFCLAKWLQHTVYLQTGMNHSCHHPPAHKIPLEEVRANPKALHNTKFKKEQMQKMLDGERPSECDYCWRVEDMGDNYFSDRVYKSKVSWSKPYMFDVLNAGTDDINPTYMEISFSNVCNFKCAYCGPDLSSKWYDEIKQHGGYPTTTDHNSFNVLRQQGKMPIPHREDNPYIDAFWEWWPDLYDSLHTLRLTGGEPLMSKDCWKVLKAISENPREDLTLAINTNLDVPEQLIDRLIEVLEKIGPHVKQVQIFTSGEATGAQAEYARDGLNYARWYKNCERVLEALQDKMDLVFAFMTTVNIYSVGTFHLFLKDVLKLRERFVRDSIAQGNILPCMTNYLRWPQMMAVTNLDDETKAEVTASLQDIINNYRIGLRDSTGVFWEDEINQIERLLTFMNNDSVGNVNENRYNFKRFVDEYDRRRGKDFHATFPNLHRFYEHCSNVEKV
jgi:pyruvate-formate lyase-activating enzyme